MLYRFIVLIIISVLVLLSWQTITNVFSTETDNCQFLTADEDDELTNQIQILRGEVKVINGKTKAIEPPSKQSIIFQRIGCKK